MTRFQKALVVTSMLILTAITLAFASVGKVKGETLNISEVEKRFGSEKFDGATFRSGSIEKRASMAASLIKNKSQYVGVDGWRIRELLGTFSGHYFSEKYPTYFIYRAKDRSDASWQLLFVIDKEAKVSDIVVHKNCCD